MSGFLFPNGMTYPVRFLVRVDVYHDADFDDATYLPLDGTRPRDLTGKTLELVVRPTFDYPTPIAVFSTADVPARIIIDDPPRGGIFFAVPQATIQTFAVGEWAQFLNLIDGTSRIEIWRGPFVVNAGLVPP